MSEHSRRTVLACAAGVASYFHADVSGKLAVASDFPPGEDNAVFPFEADIADFSSNWLLERDSDIAPFVPAHTPDIPEQKLQLLSSIRFSQYDEIVTFFLRQTGGTFIDWFNERVAQRGSWLNKRISARDAAVAFERFWLEFIQTTELTSVDFLCYMAIFINEVEGRLVSVTERYGRPPQHPGISYLFNSIEIQSPTGAVWRKQSYNRSPLNRLAAHLFNSEDFNRAHDWRPGAESLTRSGDSAWLGTNFPLNDVDPNPASSAYIRQADFVKFRGRGLIQTTWRENYKKLIEFIQSYNGENQILRRYRERWAGRNQDDVCHISSSDDWDNIFSGTNNIIVCEAIRQHARLARYFPVSSDPVALNGTARGSIRFMGDAVGGRGYGGRLKPRVRQMINTLLP
jgi:hypothetical protein